MYEKEVRGYINSESEFLTKIIYFRNQFPKNSFNKRLSLTLADYDNLNLETKIRITNREVDITQKLGDFTALSRDENTVHIKNPSAEDISGIFFSYKNLMSQVKNPMLVLIQHENYLFENDKIEIKLFKQFGKEQFFGFEVEALNGTQNDYLINFCKENDLEIDNKFNTKESILLRNSNTNINVEFTSKEQLIEIVNSYLDY